MSEINIFPEGEYTGDIFQKYCNRIFRCSAIGANDQRKIHNGKMRGDVWVAILFEHLFFYVALTDGLGLYESSEQRRDRIVQRLTEVLIPHAVDYVFDDIQNDKNQATKVQYLSLCAARVESYGRFERVLPVEGEDLLEKTALGAFCNLVSELAGDAGEVAHMMTAHAHIQESIEFLGMDVFAALAG